jgi:pimeloyl-ACP methyl ester carboxylesterase
LGAALDRFDSREWFGDLEIPAVVIITTADAFISAVRQRKLAERLDARVLLIDGDHDLFLADTRRFSQRVTDACTSLDDNPSPAASGWAEA